MRFREIQACRKIQGLILERRFQALRNESSMFEQLNEIDDQEYQNDLLEAKFWSFSVCTIKLNLYLNQYIDDFFHSENRGAPDKIFTKTFFESIDEGSNCGLV